MDADSWGRINKSILDWQDEGFQYRDVPWLVPEEYNLITAPSRDFLVNSKLGSHVGSAEQSFVYLDLTGQLPRGKWIACTPCFRTEEHLDDLHQAGFMKVELYQTDDICSFSLDVLVNKALNWFEKALEQSGVNRKHAYLAPTSDGVDIMVNGIEVGSYGIRSYEHLTWIYGTALAEPRFSVAAKYARDARHIS